MGRYNIKWWTKLWASNVGVFFVEVFEELVCSLHCFTHLLMLISIVTFYINNIIIIILFIFTFSLFYFSFQMLLFFMDNMQV